MPQPPFIPIVPFLERLFVLPSGQSVKLEPHQKRILEYVFSPGPDGFLPFQQFVYSAPKKSGKSAIAAFLASWFAFSGIIPRNGEIFFVCNDLEQSSSRSFRELRRAIQQNNLLMGEVHKFHERFLELKNGTIVQPLANDFAGAAGSNPNVSLFDELWAVRVESGRRLFEEMAVPPTRKNAMRIITTYAGWSGESELLEDIYKKVVTPENAINLGEYTNYEMNKKTWLPCYTDGHTFCLHPRSSILFADGRRVCASKVVNKKMTGYVWGMKDGQRVARPICGWHKSPLGDRTYIRVGYVSGYGMRRGTWVTNDHEIFTPTGRRRADELRDGDLILTDGAAPNDRQMALIMGTLLGDGHLTHDRTTRSELRLIHCKDQVEWIFLKTLALGRIGLESSRWVRRSDRAYNVETRSSQALLDLRRLVYPQGGKVVPRELVESLWSAEMLAAWFLDDGVYDRRTGSARICTQSFSVEDCSFLAELLCKHGIRTTVYHHASFGGSGCCLYVTAVGMRQLESLIGHLVPPTMRYKIGPDAPPFVEDSWNLGPCVLDAKPAHIQRRAASGNMPRWSYCIDVEDAHNFFSGHVLVRNCYWDHEPRMPWQDAEYYKRQMNEPGFRWSAFRRIHRNEWVEAESGIEQREWQACRDEALKANYVTPIGPDKNRPIAAGVDVSLVKDRTSVVTIFRRDDRFWLGPRNCWQPTHDEPLNFESTVEAYLLQLQENFFLSVVYYDPWQFESSAQRLREKGINMVAWPQTQPNTIKMTEFFLDTLREAKLILYPDDDLDQEAKMVSIKEVPGRGRRFVKDNKRKKIDSIIAASMALLACSLHVPDFESLGDQVRLLPLRRGTFAD